MATVIPSAEVVVTSTTETAVDGAMTEIPFVPAALRQTVKAEVVDDTIVVVGQRQKKRKRSKKADKTDFSGVETPSTPAEDTRAGPEGIVPFDFASAPNILDDVPSDQEGGRAGKRRRSKKRYGGFSFDSFSPYLIWSRVCDDRARRLGYAKRWEGDQKWECDAYIPVVR
jgi:exosome complex exonuclease RRP6